MTDTCGNIIDVDAVGWKTKTDLYTSVLPLLGAPAWHGTSVNALVESMIWGEINAVHPPYTLLIHNTGNLPPSIVEQLSWLKKDLDNAREEFRLTKGNAVDVYVQLIP